MNKKPNILVFEQNSENADLLAKFLKESKLDCTTTHVFDKNSFMSALESNHCQLILSEYHLPKVGGCEAR